eukprot:scaffold1828_cov62-Phaeocystis_antarctica.AAC.11
MSAKPAREPNFFMKPKGSKAHIRLIVSPSFPSASAAAHSQKWSLPPSTSISTVPAGETRSSHTSGDE